MKERAKISRNDPCPCGSGAKYKRCCIDKSFTWVRDSDGTVSREIPMMAALRVMMTRFSMSLRSWRSTASRNV